MHKKVLSSVLCIVALFLMLPAVAHADMGPKPSVVIDFIGIEDEVYYITLLSERESTGPYSFSTSPIDEDSFLVSEHTEEGLAAWQAFRDYQDGDGFYFIEYFERFNEQDTFAWTYFPPDTFKVLVYFPKEESFLSSGIVHKYAFDSYYLATLSQDGTSMMIEESYDASAETTSLVVRILLTLAVEILLALVFGLRQKNILIFVLAVNVVTQITLNILLNMIHYANGGIAYIVGYIGMELLVILLEAVAYTIYFRKANQANTGKPVRTWVAPVYAIVANSASFVVGMLISTKLPGIF